MEEAADSKAIPDLPAQPEDQVITRRKQFAMKKEKKEQKRKRKQEKAEDKARKQEEKEKKAEIKKQKKEEKEMEKVRKQAEKKEQKEQAKKDSKGKKRKPKNDQEQDVPEMKPSAPAGPEKADNASSSKEAETPDQEMLVLAETSAETAVGLKVKRSKRTGKTSRKLHRMKSWQQKTKMNSKRETCQKDNEGKGRKRSFEKVQRSAGSACPSKKSRKKNLDGNKHDKKDAKGKGKCDKSKKKGVPSNKVVSQVREVLTSCGQSECTHPDWEELKYDPKIFQISVYWSRLAVGVKLNRAYLPKACGKRGSSNAKTKWSQVAYFSSKTSCIYSNLLLAQEFVP